MENKDNKFKAFICSGWGRTTIILLSYIVIFCAICCILGLITYLGEIGIIGLLVFMAILAIFGWRALRKVTPRIFLILPIIGWIIFFLIKAILSFIIGIFVAPYVIAQGIANIVQKSMNNQVEHNKPTDPPTSTIHNETKSATDQGPSSKQTGENTDSTTTNTTTANLQGMKWHNFLVNFGLHAQTVFFLIFGIGLVILSFLDNSALCNFFNYTSISLEPIVSTMIYIGFGVYIAIAGVLSFWTRKYLLEYKLGGITLLEVCIYLGTVTMSVFIPLIIFYSDSLNSLHDMIDEDIWSLCFVFSCLLLLIGGIIYQMINRAYYKRRKHLFNK